MTRRAYLAIAWTPQNANAAVRASQIKDRMEVERDWTRAGATDRLAVWTTRGAPLPVRALVCASGFVIGDLFPMPGATAGDFPWDDPSTAWRSAPEVARRLRRAYWGHYVALIQGAPSSGAAVFRDPSGMVDAMTWSLDGGVEVIASDMTRAPRGLRPNGSALNWDRIGRFVASPAATTTAPLFDDVYGLEPGQLRALGARAGVATNIWTPVEFAQPTRMGIRAIQQEMVSRVDGAAAALVRGHGRVLMELSGGLDSSILGAAFAATGQAGRVAEWINYSDLRPEADESTYARTVTDRIGERLSVTRKVPTALDEASLAELAAAVWPALSGVDLFRDRHAVARLRSTGATAIVSGQGGDGVFFQFPSALVAADELQRRGWAALGSPLVAEVARRTHQSVWGVLGQLRAARRGTARTPRSVSTLLTAEMRAGTQSQAHRWVQDARAQGLPPGKVLHIQGIATTHLYHGQSRRRREADLLYPLFAQPVLELALSVPTPDLAGGNYDRPWARAAFADRLPDAVLRRRAKGNQSTYFARVVTASADMLRPYLLDGALCSAGVLDRTAVAQALDPQHLIWDGAPTDVLMAAAAEAWVRYWQGQVPDSPISPRGRSRG